MGLSDGNPLYGSVTCYITSQLRPGRPLKGLPSVGGTHVCIYACTYMGTFACVCVGGTVCVCVDGILYLYSLVCNEFFLGVFGLVLVLEFLLSHDRRPPVRHPPHHHLLGHHGAAFLRCALLVVTTVCALLIWRHAFTLPPHAPHAVSVSPVLSNRLECPQLEERCRYMSTDSCTPPDCASVS